MKAIRVHKFGGPEVLQYETNVPIPKTAPGTVLVRVHAVGVNPVETYIRAGAYARKPKLPFTPGNDCAGVVEEVGSGISQFKKGDRVYVGGTLSGAYAEYALVEANKTQLLPDAISFEQGTALGVPYQTAYRALVTRGKVRSGEYVLVHGASGGVGTAAVQIARAYGMHTLGTAGSEEGSKMVRRAGAHECFNHRQEGYLDAIRAATEKRGGVDVIVENSAHINLGNDLTLLRKNGRVAVVGNRGPVEVNAREAMTREAIITGVMLFHATEEERLEADAAIQAGIETGWLRPLVGRRFSLEEASKAHEDIIAKTALGKMVLTVP